MSPAIFSHATAHDRATLLQKGRRIAADLAIASRDPAAKLTMPDRIALGALSLVVDAEVCRLAGVEPRTTAARAEIAAALTEIERRG